MSTTRMKNDTEQAAPPSRKKVISPADLGNLRACVEDARIAALDGDTGPADPLNFHELRGRLEASRGKLPPLYAETVFTPFTAALDEMGAQGFTELLLRDPQRDGIAGLLLDIAHAILQNGEGYQEAATDGFQEVVSDLYDGFLSAEDRRGVEQPDEGVIPPLVKWGNPDFGPYTWPVDATLTFGVRAAVVNLPPSNGRRGLLAWAALGHETAGHDILHADSGLKGELASAVQQGLLVGNLGQHMADYWSSRIDETASDVLGILNMGPAAGIGLIGYFRGLRGAFEGVPRLSNEGWDSDPHPADIVRGYLVGETVRLLQFDDHETWAECLLQETDRDLATIRLAGQTVTAAVAKKSAKTVADAIVRTRLSSLENHALGEIQTWRNLDESIVARIRETLETGGPVSDCLADGFYAAHVVAAAVTHAVAAGGDPVSVFARMVNVLKAMHDGNPSWGPLFVAHPGNVVRHRTFVRSSPERAA